MRNIDFPFHFDNRGQTAVTDDNDHIRDMIEQFLFTNQGERVNRPAILAVVCCNWFLHRIAQNWQQRCNLPCKRDCNSGWAM